MVRVAEEDDADDVTDIEIYLIGPWLVVVRKDDDAIDTDDFNGQPAVPSDDDLV